MKLRFLLSVLLFGLGPRAHGETAWGYVYAPASLRLFPLTAEETRLGRLAENEVILTSPRVSRRHAVIRRSDAGAELTDVGSSNGSRVDGQDLRPRSAVRLRPGARIELADVTLLYHTSLDALWREEIRQRLLSYIVKLRHPLPQDQTRTSFGREEIVLAVSDARIDAASGEVDFEHSVAIERGGFATDSGAFVGNVSIVDGVLELSLWGVEAGETMTSRRSSFSRLRHATLRVSIDEPASDGDASGSPGPLFPPSHLNQLFEVFPDAPEISLQFAHSLSNQQRSIALHDAAETLSFRHQLEPRDGELLLLAARSKGLWVEQEVGARWTRITNEDKVEFARALEDARRWLQESREAGADGIDGAEAAILRAEERLGRAP